jgi:hypothetical protein
MSEIEYLKKRIFNLEKIVQKLLDKNKLYLTFCPDCGEECSMTFCTMCGNSRCHDCLIQYKKCFAEDDGGIFYFCKMCEEYNSNEKYVKY